MYFCEGPTSRTSGFWYPTDELGTAVLYTILVETRAVVGVSSVTVTQTKKDEHTFEDVTFAQVRRWTACGQIHLIFREREEPSQSMCFMWPVSNTHCVKEKPIDPSMSVSFVYDSKNGHSDVCFFPSSGAGVNVGHHDRTGAVRILTPDGLV